MNSYYIHVSILEASWLPPVIIGGIRFRILDAAARIFWLNVLVAFLTDCVAVWAALQWRNNALVYNLGSVVYVVLICLYTDQRINSHVKSRVALYLAMASVAIGIVSLYFIKPAEESNTYFRVYMVIIIVAQALISMGFIVFQPVYTDVRKQPHFWLAAILIAFWSFLYLHLLLYDYFTLYHGAYKWLIDRSILIANVANNLAIALVFLLIPKMRHHESQST